MPKKIEEGPLPEYVFREPPDDTELNEVEEYLRLNRARYEIFSDALEAECRQIRQSPLLARKIYRIYSRSANQSGVSLKSTYKIAEKLHDWRKNKKTVCEEIHDIIGITIVCMFPSDLDHITNFVKNRWKGKRFKAIRFDQKRDKGYVANHIVVRSCDSDHKGLLCEVQIKTMLHDVWGAKTHDLTYKPIRHIDNKVVVQMNKLGETLKILDEQSEIVKSAIEEQMNLDQDARVNAALKLLDSGRRRDDKDLTPESSSEISPIYDDIERIARDGEGAQFRTPPFQSVRKKLELYAKKHGVNKALCRAAASISALDFSQDHDPFTYAQLTEYVSTKLDGTGRNEILNSIDALNFSAVVRLAMRDYLGASKNFREAIARCHNASNVLSEKNLKKLDAFFHMNLAYVLQEGYYVGAGGFSLKDAEHAVTICRSIIGVSDAKLVIKPAERPARDYDTFGACLISLGESERAVRDGLEFCQLALMLAVEKSEDEPHVHAYAKLHERRAFQRLLNYR